MDITFQLSVAQCSTPVAPSYALADAPTLRRRPWRTSSPTAPPLPHRLVNKACCPLSETRRRARPIPTLVQRHHLPATRSYKRSTLPRYSHLST